MGSIGYGVYTLIGDTPTGPFHADAPAYRLCGNATRSVAFWARFCQTNEDLLINGYMYSGYTYETGDAWLPPIKKAVVDSGGHLRLGYWNGNNALKGTPVNVDLSKCQKVYPEEAKDCSCTFRKCEIVIPHIKAYPEVVKDYSCTLKANGLDIQGQPETDSVLMTNIPTTVAILDSAFDFSRGIVMEGTIQVTCNKYDPRYVASSVGFYLEEKHGEGTAVILHGYGRTEIGKLILAGHLAFTVEDVIGPGCAAPAGIVPDIPHMFRLFVRKNMFELYLDEMLVQTFNTTHEPGSIGITPQRIGFVAQNGRGGFENVKIWAMTLDE